MRLHFTNGLIPLSDLARGVAPLARNLLGAAAGTPLADAPAFILWGLTNRCPLRCRHCDMGEPIDELTHAQRLDVAHRIGRSKVWAVSLVGGEVTILPGLAEYAAVLKRYGKYVTLSTSGLGVERHLDALLAAGLDSITFSIDSHRAEAHDAFRGPAGLFGRVSEIIARIRRERRDGGPSVQVRGTINRTNFRELEAYLDHWLPRADNVVLQIVQNNAQHTVRDPAVLFRDEDRGALEAVIASLRERHSFLRTTHTAHMADYVYDADALFEDLGFRCVLVPATSMAVFPDGSVRLCPARADSEVGSVLDREVSALWRDTGTRATQRRMQSHDYGCMCWEQASGGNLDLLPAHRLAERLLGRRRATV